MDLLTAQDRPVPTTLPMAGALTGAPREFARTDHPAAARLRRLDARLTVIGQAFPAMESDIQLCRLTCAMLEGAWHERVHGPRTVPSAPCACALCALLPVPPRRDVNDYLWRRSDGRPLSVKIWPYRPELDSVLTAGWVWLRKVNDHEIDLGLRNRYEDDILAFHEYKRVVNAVDVEQTTRSTYQRLNRVLAAARYIPVERLGTCDDCGFSPFADDTSTSRETAFAKIEARVAGTRMAAEALGV